MHKYLCEKKMIYYYCETSQKRESEIRKRFNSNISICTNNPDFDAKLDIRPRQFLRYSSSR